MLIGKKWDMIFLGWTTAGYTLSGSPTHDVSDQDHHVVKFGPLVSLLTVIIQGGWWDNQPKLKSFCEFKRAGHVPILNLEIRLVWYFGIRLLLAATTNTRNKSNQKLGMALWLVNGPQPGLQWSSGPEGTWDMSWPCDVPGSVTIPKLTDLKWGRDGFSISHEYQKDWLKKWWCDVKLRSNVGPF